MKRSCLRVFSLERCILLHLVKCEMNLKLLDMDGKKKSVADYTTFDWLLRDTHTHTHTFDWLLRDTQIITIIVVHGLACQ